jgi:hypothetical protein
MLWQRPSLLRFTLSHKGERRVSVTWDLTVGLKYRRGGAREGRHKRLSARWGRKPGTELRKKQREREREREIKQVTKRIFKNVVVVTV